MAPAKGATVSDARPTLTWPPLPGARVYRVEIESRVPEGAVLKALDTQVKGTSFRPPSALTEDRAAVKVRVTSDCPADDGGRLREKPAHFQVDTAPLCPAPKKLAPSADRQQLEWSSTAALRYDVTLVSLEGAVLQRGQTRETRFPLPAAAPALVAVVRPYCATGFGPRVSALVGPGKP